MKKVIIIDRFFCVYRGIVIGKKDKERIIMLTNVNFDTPKIECKLISLKNADIESVILGRVDIIKINEAL
jgi:hypothetical protein